MGGKILADVVRVVTSWEVDCLFRGNERTRNIHSTINASFFVSSIVVVLHFFILYLAVNK